MSITDDPVDEFYRLVQLILTDLKSIDSSFSREEYRSILSDQINELIRLAGEIDIIVAQHISDHDIAIEYASLHHYLMYTRRNFLGVFTASSRLVDAATAERAKKYFNKAQKRLGKKRRFLWSKTVPFSPKFSVSREVTRIRNPAEVPKNWRAVNRYVRDTKRILGPVSVELLNMQVRPKGTGYRCVFSVASGCATRRD